MQKRLDFAQSVAQLGRRQLRERLSFSMDGVILSLSPTDPVDRRNYCFHGTGHMWRKASEAASPELAGHDPYAGQATAARALPLWGGISAGGFAPVMFHRKRKFNTE